MKTDTTPAADAAQDFTSTVEGEQVSAPETPDRSAEIQAKIDAALALAASLEAEKAVLDNPALAAAQQAVEIAGKRRRAHNRKIVQAAKRLATAREKAVKIVEDAEANVALRETERVELDAALEAAKAELDAKIRGDVPAEGRDTTDEGSPEDSGAGEEE